MRRKTDAARGKRTASDTSPTSVVNGNTACKSALAAAKRGCLIVPCNAHKKPLIEGWTTGTASRDPDQIREWDKWPACKGFAVLCGEVSGEVVVDIDTHRNGSTQGLDLPPTYTVRTPNGGRHLHYRHSGPIKTNPELAEGVELHGDGSLAILPGSAGYTKSGEARRYRRIKPKQGTVALPPGLAAPRAADGPRSAAGTISNGQRNSSLTTLAGRMRRMGASEDELRAALVAFNVERCDEPLADYEIDGIARSVGSYAGGYEAQVADAVQHLRVQRDALAILNAPTQSFEPPPEMSASEYLAIEDGPIPYTVERLTPTGANVAIVARAKTGKTTVTINLIRSLIDGDPLFGRFAIDNPDGKTGVLDYEMIPRDYRDWLRRNGIRNVDRLVPPWHLRGKPNPLRWEEEIVAWLREHEITTLIIDSAARAYAGFVENDNAASQMTPWLDLLDRIKLRAGVRDLWLIVHAGNSEDIRPRGTTRLSDWPDALWYYEGKGDEPRVFSAYGRGVDLEKHELTFDRETHRLTIRASVQSRDDDVAAYAAIDALAVSGEESVTTSAFQDLIKNSALRYGIGVAVRRGWVDKEPGKSPSGKAAQLHSLSEAGRIAQSRRVR